MLDDLKRERHAANPGRDLFKLAIYVVGMLIFGIVIFAGTKCGSTPAQQVDRSQGSSRTLFPPVRAGSRPLEAR